MKNKNKKIILEVLLAFLITLIVPTISNASSLSISTSKSTVSANESFTVTVSLSGAAGKINISVNNGTGSTSQFIDDTSYTFNCTAGSSGSVTINASGTVGDYITETDVDKSASKSVTIATATTPTTPTTTPTTTTTTTKSTDSSLKALAVAEGTITPAFSKDVKAYTLNVATEITEVNVSATVNNSRATYTVVGNKDLKEGENLVTVTVKAENRNNYSLYN